MNCWQPLFWENWRQLKQKRKPYVKTATAFRSEREEQALVKEVRDAKLQLEARQEDLRAWRLLHGCV